MIYIKDNNKLKGICKEIKNVTKIIAVDTEFLRQREYFPKLCLIQVGYSNKGKFKTILIDALSEGLDLKPFASILQNKRIKKVIHCPIQDIEAFYYITKKIPNGVEDTQLMAEFCGYRHYMGYTNLINELCEKNLEKSKTTQRSDWTKRPLSKKQLKYAANDVKYLIEMYEILKEKLKKNKNLKFYKDEIKRKFNKKLISNVINDSWKRLRFKLNGKHFLYVSIVKNLSRWREKESMKYNTIRINILPDSAIRNIAKNSPKNKTELKIKCKQNREIEKLSQVNIKEILKCVKDGKKKYYKYKKSIKKETLFYYEPKGKDNKRLYNKIVDFIKSECKEKQIAQELVLNKANIVSVMMNFEKMKDVFYGWKYKVFGKGIKEILKS